MNNIWSVYDRFDHKFDNSQCAVRSCCKSHNSNSLLHIQLELYHDMNECVTDSGQVELGAADYFSVLDAATVQQQPGENIYEKLSSDKTLIQVAALQTYVKDRDKVPGGFLPEYKVSSTLQSNAINICRHKATS